LVINFLIGGELVLTGLQLKIKRVEQRMKAQDLALKLNVTKSYISKLENEKQEIPLHIYQKWIQILKQP
jgi:transcriptional regulator with XRE-family HTH domain